MTWPNLEPKTRRWPERRGVRLPGVATMKQLVLVARGISHVETSTSRRRLDEVKLRVKGVPHGKIVKFSDFGISEFLTGK